MNHFLTKLRPRDGQLFSTMTARMNPLTDRLTTELSEIQHAGTYKTERVITSPQGPAIHVSNKTTSVLNFCANNYLGLSNHPAVIEAAKAALDTHGFGLSSVRFICGTLVWGVGIWISFKNMNRHTRYSQAAWGCDFSVSQYGWHHSLS